MTATGLMKLLYHKMKTSKRFDDIEFAEWSGDKRTLVVYPFDSRPIILTAILTPRDTK